jgi:hypothetical protein
MEEDPLGLAAGPNPYEYVGNRPTNAIDPSGLFYQVINKGTEVDKQLIGEGIVTFPDGTKGKIRVWTNVTIGQYAANQAREAATDALGLMASPAGGIATASSLQYGSARVRKQYPNVPLTNQGGILIEYSGPHAADVHIIQTLWTSVYYKTKAGEEGYGNQTFKIAGQPRKLSQNPADPNSRNYYLDYSPREKSPFATPEIRPDGKTLQYVDAPNISISLVLDFISAKIDETKDRDYRNKLSAVEGTSLFDSMLVYDAKALYTISWTATSQLGKTSAPPALRVTGGGPNMGPNNGQLQAIQDAFPGINAIKK